MESMEQERRSEARMLCADMVEIRWKDRSGKQKKATALLEDIASSGACLQMEAPVPLGVEISWDSPKQFFSGYVRYCVYREIGYFLGVEFSRATKWSKQTYTPQHLLDLEKLVASSKRQAKGAATRATGAQKPTCRTTMRG
jgi:hypothetical protein